MGIQTKHLPGQHDQEAHGGEDVNPTTDIGQVKNVSDLLHKYAFKGSYVGMAELFAAAKTEGLVNDRKDFIQLITGYLNKVQGKTSRGFPIYTELVFDKKNNFGIRYGRRQQNIG